MFLNVFFIHLMKTLFRITINNEINDDEIYIFIIIINFKQK